MYSLYLIIFLTGANCFNFDVENVQVFVSDNHSYAGYFGYSVLLQKGYKDASIFVGAPKANSTYLPQVDSPGAVFKCSLQSNLCNEHFVNDEVQDQVEKRDGQMLGASLDGGTEIGTPLIICAPKNINKRSSEHYFTNGICYLYRNSSTVNSMPLAPLSKLSEQIMVKASNAYYHYGFGEMGMSIAFNQVDEEILIGAPGVDSWSGSILQYRVTPYNLIKSGPFTFTKKSYEYYGYAVSFGKFHKASSSIWYVISSPRAADLLGEVILYELRSRIHKELQGEQKGSYFGSSVLAVDTNNDKADDLFIGAPTYSTNAFDEGCVYYYRNKGDGNFDDPVRLQINSGAGARFGSALADIGDLNIDTYKDVAISAPYEEGVGAVYIYLGNREGIDKSYSQKISPSFFTTPLSNVRGFGYSISKGVDVDNNSHNDIAIGAYLSDKVFVVKSRPILKFIPRMFSHTKELSLDDKNPFKVEYCLRYSSTIENPLPVFADVHLVIDSRLAADYNSSVELISTRDFCQNITMRITTSVLYSTDPLLISLFYKQNKLTDPGFCSQCPVQNPNEENRFDLEIPFAHGCGDDGVCHTQLHIEAHFKNLNEHLVLGSAESVVLQTTILNSGEPAYACHLQATLPPDVTIALLPESCNLDRNTLKCLIENKLGTGKSKSLDFKLDVQKLNTGTTSLVVSLNVSSAGQEDSLEDNNLDVILPIVLDVNPQINWISDPYQSNYVTEEGTVRENVTVIHKYSLTNSGKSPYDIQMYILVPTEIDNTKIVDILQVEGIISNNRILTCVTSAAMDSSKNFDIEIEVEDNVSQALASSNRTIPAFCDQNNIKCVNISCSGGQLSRLSQVATVNLKMNVFVKDMAQKFQDTLYTKDHIVVTSTAYTTLTNGKSRTTSRAYTIFFGNGLREPIAVWIIVLSVIGGLLLMAIIIFLLYKFNFFKRLNKEELLKNERNSSQTSLRIGTETPPQAEYSSDGEVHRGEEDIQRQVE